jgi:tetratricopeptide (TPR) repeat protein
LRWAVPHFADARSFINGTKALQKAQNCTLAAGRPNAAKSMHAPRPWLAQRRSCRSMHLRLHTRARKLTLLAVMGVGVLWFLYLAGSIFLASRLARSLESAQMERAIRLEPSNANYRTQLARYLLFVQHQPEEAVARFHEASALNPYPARVWLDLASAHQILGWPAEQAAALEEALRREPTTPDVAWEAANFYLVRNEVQRAFPLLRTVMEHDSDRQRPALSLALRVSDSLEQIWPIVPPQADAHIALLNLLMEAKRVEDSKQVWKRLAGLGQPFDATHALNYVQFLIEAEEPGAAQQTWDDLLRLDPSLSAYRRSHNLLVNPGFDLDLLDAGFDWRFPNQGPVRMELDATDFHSGPRSLALHFQGLAVSDAGLWQYVPVNPGTKYRLEGYLKAANLESASGPRLAVVDPYSAVVYATTPEITGSGGWIPVATEFTAGPTTRLVSVRVRRVPGDKLISGQLWIDSLSFTELP